MTPTGDAFEKQRKRIEEMLDFFVRLLTVMTIAGAALALLYGLCAGTGHRPAGPVAATTTAARAPGAAAKIIPTQPKAAEVPASQPADAASLSGSLTAAFIALAICGAAAAVGSALGFLFGLPRTITGGDVRKADPAGQEPSAGGVARTPTAATSPLATNTNLEQISDWLTKIIVGVGLTKLNGIVGYLESFGVSADGYFGFGGKAFAIAAGLYFLIVGFFIGYILTRTKLTWIFVGSDREADVIVSDYNQQLAEAAIKSAGEPVDPKSAPLVSDPKGPGPSSGGGGTPSDGGGPGAPSGPVPGAGPASSTPADVVSADQAMLSAPIVKFNSVEELAGRAAAEARAGNLQSAAVLYEQVARDAPSGRHLVDYAGVLGLLGKEAAAADVIATIRTVAPEQTEEASAKMLLGLLRSGLYDGGYERSISAGEELLTRPAQARDPWVLLWLACAYGQRHQAMQKADIADPRLPATAARVVEHLRQSISIDPAMKPVIASLYDKSKETSGDDDLQSLFPNGELDDLLK